MCQDDNNDDDDKKSAKAAASQMFLDMFGIWDPAVIPSYCTMYTQLQHTNTTCRPTTAMYVQ